MWHGGQEAWRDPAASDHAGNGGRLDRGSHPRHLAERVGQPLAPAPGRISLRIRPRADPRDDRRGARSVHLRDLLSVVDDFRELLACPACAGTLAADWSCCGCGARYDVLDGIAALRLAAAAAQRFRVDRVQFVETDLQRPGLKRGAFDVVYSSGVLHHTPDPRASFARLAQLARPGGTIVLGVYNAFARLPARLRRVAARLSGDRLVAFDAVLRERQYEPARRDAWLRDQYQHPEEHSHTLSEVQGWFAENGVEYLRAYPSALLDGEPEDLFARAPDNWLLEGWLAQLEWIWTLGREGGLFFTIGRRASCARP